MIFLSQFASICIVINVINFHKSLSLFVKSIAESCINLCSSILTHINSVSRPITIGGGILQIGIRRVRKSISVGRITPEATRAPSEIYPSLEQGEWGYFENRMRRKYPTPTVMYGEIGRPSILVPRGLLARKLFSLCLCFDSLSLRSSTYVIDFDVGERGGVRGR